MLSRLLHIARCVAMFAYVVAGLAAFPVVLAGKMLADTDVAVDVAAFRPVVIRALQVSAVVLALVGAHVA